MTADLMTEAELTEWYLDRESSHGPHCDTAPIDERSWYDLIRFHLGPQFLGDFENFLVDHRVEAQDQVLMVVGTLCLLNGQRALWSAIFHTVIHDTDAGEEFRFLAE